MPFCKTKTVNGDYCKWIKRLPDINTAENRFAATFENVSTTRDDIIKIHTDNDYKKRFVSISIREPNNHKQCLSALNRSLEDRWADVAVTYITLV